MFNPDSVNIPNIPDGNVVSEKDKKTLLDLFDPFAIECKNAGFTMSYLTLGKIAGILIPPSEIVHHGEIRKLVKELQGRVIDELSIRLFMSIDADKQSFFAEKNLFGQQVTDRFPSSITDIEEAGKCLALSRGTACVFHLMRIMEVGLHALATSLKDAEIDPKTLPNWEAILKKIEVAVETEKKKQPAGWADFYEETTTMLRAVKIAWRNPTMHVEKTYTEEMALDVWNVVGAFMRHLSTRLSEPVNLPSFLRSSFPKPCP